jgi:hypothetical protein
VSPRNEKAFDVDEDDKAIAMQRQSFRALCEDAGDVLKVIFKHSPV